MRTGKPTGRATVQHMERVGVRELRQHASRWLARVQAGESFEVTDRGRPVALLVPPPVQAGIARLEAEGLLSRAEGDLRALPPPLPQEPGGPSLSDVLRSMRDDDRY